MDNMDALTERVIRERLRILSTKLDIAIRQRNGFAQNYHALTNVPFQERREIMKDCDEEIDLAGKVD